MRTDTTALATVALVIGLLSTACSSSTPEPIAPCPFSFPLGFEGRSYMAHDGFVADVPLEPEPLTATGAPPCEDRFGRMTLHAILGVSKRVAIASPRYPGVVYVIESARGLPSELQAYLAENA